MDKEQVIHMNEDPWRRKQEEEPPGLDEILGDVFGKKGQPQGFFLPLILFCLLMIAASGFFIVSPSEQAVILRFGKIVRVAGPGPNWVIPGVEDRYIVNTQKISSYNYSAEMLTRDESYADVDVTVFYRVKAPEKFLFRDVDAIESLSQATASALRQVVGNTELEAILTDGRIQARDEIQAQIESIMMRYDNGIEVTDTKLQDARPPQAVKSAFDDVIQAREDYDRFIMDAEGHRNNVIPQAEGMAMRIENQANAEYESLLNEAKANIAGFNALVEAYKNNPEIVKNQVFVSTMRQVYGKTKKMFLSSTGQLNVLPLDQFTTVDADE